ncbi:uncharacterized protein AMSG_12082 [Thecamonas trahens ATCC 50062]|uniref:Uncharacterized protein n=1 Tax=Thecamonas trahens ATCC 50062 TaxID=461836 RepID=A0A0L0DGG3_THETB|nr:hypothetical protein AMSG_12082 [Thecamonas trahens ATCC 50062]KNC51422.1 hypothetical protein AMSG_12082 [Thecamonas trahens ATCC 50062]|eukprot:XP_013756162.1 hypothetical protein AMSG_12082 [Thecamonas trahens ATCC 50062]
MASRKSGRARPIMESLRAQPGLAGVRLEGLAERVTRMAARMVRKNGALTTGFEHEFNYTMHVAELSSFLREAGPGDDGLSSENLYKNRYANIIPFDANRLRLNQLAPSVDPPASGPLLPAEPDPDAPLTPDAVEATSPSVLPVMVGVAAVSEATDYVNASKVSGIGRDARDAYIVAQAPLPWTMEAYWSAIWQEGISHIVMLTDFVESSVIKADKYWPPPRSAAAAAAAPGTALGPGALTAGPFRIATASYEVDSEAGAEIRVLLLTRVDGRPGVEAETRTIKHFHFRAWPDHGVPEDSAKFLVLIQQVWASRGMSGTPAAATSDGSSSHSALDDDSNDDESASITEDEAPLLVHCSAGVGRTGVFVVVDAILRHVHAEIEAGTPAQDITVSIPLTVLELRKQRRYFVQTPQQYELCYTAVLNYITNLLDDEGTSSPANSYCGLPQFHARVPRGAILRIVAEDPKGRGYVRCQAPDGQLGWIPSSILLEDSEHKFTAAAAAAATPATPPTSGEDLVEDSDLRALQLHMAELDMAGLPPPSSSASAPTGASPHAVICPQADLISHDSPVASVLIECSYCAAECCVACLETHERSLKKRARAGAQAAPRPTLSPASLAVPDITGDEVDDLLSPTASGRMAQRLACVMCFERPRNAAFVHGAQAHFACCMTCAEAVMSQSGQCCICSVEIDLVVQVYTS